MKPEFHPMRMQLWETKGGKKWRGKKGGGKRREKPVVYSYPQEVGVLSSSAW